MKISQNNKKIILATLFFVLFIGLAKELQAQTASADLPSWWVPGTGVTPQNPVYNGAVQDPNAFNNGANWNSSPDVSTFKTSPDGSVDSSIPRATVVDTSGASSATANGSNTGAKTVAASPSSAQGGGSCVAGAMLARLLSSSISSALGMGTKAATGVTTAAEKVANVPVTIAGTQAARNQEAATNAHTGSFSLFGIQTGVSWDTIGYCIVNTIIDYIVNSTIAWANSGFKGNPAFIRNPEQFFKQLADREASMFIQELAYDTTGLNVCKPFRVVIATGLAGSYSRMNGNYQNSCSLSQMQQNMMQSGRYTITTPTDWIALTQPQNNAYYSYISASNELSKRIAIKNNTARFDLTINRGFLSKKKCKDDSKPESKTNPCDTTTPGSVIADSLSQTLNIPKERLVSAQKFDQMVDAIVNNLIKIALSDVLTKVTGQAPSAPMASDYYTTVANTATYNSSSYTNGGALLGTPGSGGGTLANNALVVQNPDGSYSLTTNRLSLDTDGIANPGVDPTTHQGQTSYGHGLSTYDNYVVVPDNSPIALGTAVIITDPSTGQQVTAIVGDHGGSQGHGEVSIGVANAFNIYPGGDNINSRQLQFTYTNQPLGYIPKGR